jgi:hypothetical protein
MVRELVSQSQAAKIGITLKTRQGMAGLTGYPDLKQLGHEAHQWSEQARIARIAWPKGVVQSGSATQPNLPMI